jgi:hypothetical protein
MDKIKIACDALKWVVNETHYGQSPEHSPDPFLLAIRRIAESALAKIEAVDG